MKLNLTNELRKVVQSCIWFEPAEQAIQNVPRLAAYIFTYGTPEETQILRNQLTDEGLRDCLDNAPAGIYDIKSWAYWNLIAGRFDTPPMPQRSFD